MLKRKGGTRKCLEVPGRIITIERNKGIVEIGNMKREIFMHLVPEAAINEYVIVHACSAIEKVDEEEAKIILDSFKELFQNEVY